MDYRRPCSLKKCLKKKDIELALWVFLLVFTLIAMPFSFTLYAEFIADSDEFSLLAL